MAQNRFQQMWRVREGKVSELWVASYILLWLVVAATAFVMVGVLRQLGLIQLRLGPDSGALITPEGLERGIEAPNFETIELSTKRLVHLSDFRGRRVLLIFLSPTCSPCRELIPHLNEVALGYQDKVEVLAVCHGSESACAEFGRLYLLKPILLADPTNKIAAQYGTTITPFAFLVNEDGIILIRGVVNTLPQLEALLKEEGTFQGELPWQPVVTLADLSLEGKRVKESERPLA